MSLTTEEYGKKFLYRLRIRKEVIVICSLHPMYAFGHIDGLDCRVRVLWQAMFRFNLLQALNILAGRVVHGPGESKLRDAVWGAGHTPCLLLPVGRLDPLRDTRFKGIFLAEELRRIWHRNASEENQK